MSSLFIYETYVIDWKWFICLPYSSMRLMLLIGKTYNPYLV
jgi:hypothetical protein